jgi:hypothetical protein
MEFALRNAIRAENISIRKQILACHVESPIAIYVITQMDQHLNVSSVMLASL